MNIHLLEWSREWRNGPLILFHGTDNASAESILRGVLLDVGREDTDFGRGLYTTTSRAQAEDWAQKKAYRRKLSPSVVTFIADRNRLADLEVLWFIRGTADAEDFWNFVTHCREGSTEHLRPGWYDVVAGPVTAAPIFGRSIIPGYDQVSFDTVQSLEILKAEA